MFALFKSYLVCICIAFFLVSGWAEAEKSVYHQGDPTGWEQYLLELVNRARTDPLSEANRYGLADLNEGLPDGTITSAPKPPLALNPFLITSARAHSQWMVDTDTFSHTGLNDMSSTDRIVSSGYLLAGSWGTGENIAAYFGRRSGQRTSAMDYHHLGLFLSADHRRNILDPEYDEIGIGEVTGVYILDGNEYPESSLLTQNFGYSWGSPEPDGNFLTGVVWEDLDNDGFYTPGEGVGGVEVIPDSGSWYAVTSSSGGYVIPVGFESVTLDVTFSSSELSTTVKTIQLPGGVNVKVDFLVGVDDVLNPFASAKSHPDGWFSIEWFGWFTQPRSEWVYNSQSGFRYHLVTASGGIYLFDPSNGSWYWASTSAPDIIFQLGPDGGWLGL